LLLDEELRGQDEQAQFDEANQGRRERDLLLPSSKSETSFVDGLRARILARHPGLTKEELDSDLEFYGL